MSLFLKFYKYREVLMNEQIQLTDRCKELLSQHFDFYDSLDTGEHVPDTAAQQHFREVCLGNAAPETDHEIAYHRLKRIAADQGVTPSQIAQAGFQSITDDATEHITWISRFDYVRFART